MKRKRLKTKDLFFVALYGVRARKGRATLTSIGIGIGIAAIVAVSGISASGRKSRSSLNFRVTRYKSSKSITTSRIFWDPRRSSKRCLRNG